MKIAIIQSSFGSEKKSNLEKAGLLISKAAKFKADAAIFPELFNTGYEIASKVFERKDHAEKIGGETTEFMQEQAKKSGMYIFSGILEREDSNYYSTMLYNSPNGKIESYRKVNLPAHETPFFSRGDEYKIIETDIGRIGVAICWDVTSKELLNSLKGKIDVLFVSSAWPKTKSFMRGTNDVLTKNLDILAREMNVPVAYSNHIGPANFNFPFFGVFASEYLGKSGVYHPDTYKNVYNREEVLIAEIH